MGSANSVVELKNNANKKGQVKLQCGALQSLQIFLQNLRGRKLLRKTAQLCIMPKFKEGMLLQVCRTAACVPVEALIQPQPSDFSKVLFFPRKVM